ncbi:MAG: hypothetical protein U5L09_15295 [Bacteroidales bacterium]|nr:hypothetical protein [Bacteroidales bacterium]
MLPRSRRESRRIKRKLKATKAEEKLGKVNFEALELRDIIINGQAFQLLQVKKEKGNFEFPLIKEGFSTYEVMDYYVFRADRLEQVLPSPLVFNKPYVVDLKVFVSDDVPSTIKQKILMHRFPKKGTQHSFSPRSDGVRSARD